MTTQTPGSGRVVSEAGASEGATSHGTSRTAGNTRGRKGQEGFPQRPSGGERPCPHLDFGLPACRPGQKQLPWLQPLTPRFAGFIAQSKTQSLTGPWALRDLLCFLALSRTFLLTALAGPRAASLPSWAVFLRSPLFPAPPHLVGEAGRFLPTQRRPEPVRRPRCSCRLSPPATARSLLGTDFLRTGARGQPCCMSPERRWTPTERTSKHALVGWTGSSCGKTCSGQTGPAWALLGSRMEAVRVR